MAPSTSTTPCALVVDDEPLVRMLACDILEDAGFDVSVSGPETGTVKEQDPDGGDEATPGSEVEITAEEEHAKLAAIETELDQCWDLLRQRRARREYGEDPEGAEVRSEGTVENYLS